MATPVCLYPEKKALPRQLNQDLFFLFNEVQNWRSKGAQEDGHYKLVARRLGFMNEFSPKGPKGGIGRKRVDLFKRYNTEELEYRVAIEIESSTIENAYNDLLKIMELLKRDEVDYGIVIFVQNNRSSRQRLTKGQITNNFAKALEMVLADYRGCLFLYHIDP
jgi:hypothetical protein